jgi:hypothetical protein
MRIDRYCAAVFDVTLVCTPEICAGAGGEINFRAHHPGLPASQQELRKVLLPAWSVRNAAMSASRLNFGTSAVPDSNGVPWLTTGPAAVSWRL